MSFSDVADRTMRAPSARRGLLAGALVAGALAVLPATAGAIVTHGPNGPIGYMPLNNSAEAKAAATPFAANGNLDYHGGPVMPSNKQFAIFWAPAGFSFPAGYQAGIIKFLKDVSAAHNLPIDTYSVGAQFKDSSGKFATSSMSFGGSVTDTNPIPASGCPGYPGLGGETFTICITDTQLFAEVNSVVASHGLPRGLKNQYFMFLPPGVGSCFDAIGTACFDKEFCAYHSAAGAGPTIYANESFTPVDPAGCGTGNYPNGKASGIDDELSSLSHETNEAREDPLVGSGWFNSNTGAEGADQCRNTSDDYGPLIGGTPGVNGFNQNINGGHYILQQDWSNAANGCEQFYHLTGSTFGPFKAKVGQKVEFSVKLKDFEGGHLASGKWDFGDGSKANGLKVTHKYKKTGKYHINGLFCTNTKVCLFGPRKITITKKKKHHGGHHHHKATVAAVPLRQAR
jgi:PKD domain-containing protein